MDNRPLTLLGEKTEYKYDGAQRDILECFPNPGSGDYVVSHTSDEFTSLCPKTGQPDYAVVQITITPDKLCVETKSLKLYLVSFRNTGSFMEAIGNKVFDDLMAVMKPKALRVLFQFNDRGGIATTVIRQHPQPVPLEGDE